MLDMNKINRLIQTLPPYVVACLESEEYAELFERISEKFDLAQKERDMLEDIVMDVLLKDVVLGDIPRHVKKIFGFSAEKTEELAQDIMGEFVAPFPHYFMDSREILQAFGVDEGVYIGKSILLKALMRFANEQMREHIRNIHALPLDQRRMQFHYIIEKNFIDYLSADDTGKRAFNDLAVDLFLNVKGYSAEFLRALYENKQTIGEGAHIERDGKTYSSYTVEWLKDFISFSDGDPSTLHIAQYLAQNKNARRLQEQDREILRHILEVYRTARLFPESLAHIPQEQWVIIPYGEEGSSYDEEESPSPDDRPPSAPLSPFRQDVQAQDTAREQEGAGAASAAPLPLDREEYASSFSLPESILAVPELPAPSQSLHSLAPLVVEARDAFFQTPPTIHEISAADIMIEEQLRPSPFSGKNYEELAHEVLSMSGIVITDPAFHARLQKAVVTRLRNIRTAIEIRERLSESVKTGGFGLDVKTAHAIVRNANMATDLISQGVINIKEVSAPSTSIKKDVQEIKELVRREFTPQPKKFGRSRPVASHGVPKLPFLPLVLPQFPEMSAMRNIPISMKKPVPPHPPKPSLIPPQYVSPKEFAPPPMTFAQKEKETVHVSPGFLEEKVHMALPPLVVKQTYFAIPLKLDTLPFRKALKAVPTFFAKKLSIQQTAKEAGTEGAVVSHKQPHSFFGAVDMPHIQHAGLPELAIEEVDGVPMIVEKQKGTYLTAPSTQAAQISVQKDDEEQRARKYAEEEQRKREEEKKKEEEIARKAMEEQQKKQKAEQAAREQAEKEKARKAEEEQKREAEQTQKARAEEGTWKVVEEQQKKQEEEQVKNIEQPVQEKTDSVSLLIPAQTQKPEPESISAPQTLQELSTGVMPHGQPASGGLFSNIFHIPVSVKSAPPQPGKVSFSDVRRSPRLVDTIEELKILTLKDFRRLSEDPLNAASRIYDKIQAMERESFTKKLTAIAAWRENEINMLYVQIGQTALIKGKSITSVIDQLKAEEKPYLTEQEFDAVLELNERIRM
ncbi:hypothetical protein HYW94_01480 [Candidatus Uhrbacteria bacterium]|nr:hypothetical protein [Candidatus Uhrbacteria bacterium]